MRRHGLTSGFFAGLTIGIIIGSVGLSAGAVGYKAWMTNGQDFRLGYISGFMDMTMLARNLHPQGFIDETYPFFKNARIRDYYDAIDNFYKDPENQKHSMYSAMTLISDEMEKKFGKPQSAIERMAPNIEKKLEAARAKQAARAASAGAAKAPAAAPKPAAPKPPKRKIWCKCAEMEKACPELAKDFATRKPKAEGADGEPVSPAPEAGKEPAKAEGTK
ncbi:MAG TPA: hypothetical protein VEL28_04380 [Candidatus Binatia bacterium]|nr:hypothetical protein [Candidatus Binatia bacterium]